MNVLIHSNTPLQLDGSVIHQYEAKKLADNVYHFKVDTSETILKLCGHFDKSLTVSTWPINVFDRHKRLVVFDMDSTLIQQEVIDELAREAGVVEQVKEITHMAMNGECDFKGFLVINILESLKRRVMLLKDTPSSVLLKVRDRIKFSPGARELTRILKNLGIKMAVVSGGNNI